MTEQALVIGIAPASDPRPALQLRVPTELFAETVGDLQRERVYLGVPITASAAVGDLTVLVASTAAGLGGIAAVIRAVAGRHRRHRTVRLTNREGETIELGGLSREEMDAKLIAFLAVEKDKHDEIRSRYEFGSSSAPAPNGVGGDNG